MKNSISLSTLDPKFNWRLPKLDWPVESDVGPGLAGVIAGRSRIAWIDPSEGRLYYRGVPIEEWSRKATFEQTAYLLITGRYRGEDESAFRQFVHTVRSGRRLDRLVLDLVENIPIETHPTRALRAGISAAGCHADLDGPADPADAYLPIIGQAAALTAAITRKLNRAQPHSSDENADTAQALLTALLNREPNDTESAAFNLALTLYADNGLDAPTFTGLIVASCAADPYYNIVAGLSALRGPRQGRAGELVLKQLLRLRDEQVAREWARGMAAGKWRIPGFGHRIYRTPDPRVAILKKTVEELADTPDKKRLMKVALTVDSEVAKRLAVKGVYPNINFYAALLFHFLGASPELVPCLYAVGRMAGMVARVLEYLPDGKLFRPKEQPIRFDERRWKPLEAR